jgi:hypothetical protein
MAVWAFACKKESSMNRWFDGTAQDVSFNDSNSFDLSKNKSDILDTLDEQRKVLIKSISSVRSGIGAIMFNEVKFNVFFNKLSDFDDAVMMQDDFYIDLSREVVRISDIIYPVEYFNKELESNKSHSVYTSDGVFINNLDADGVTTSGSAIENAFVSDVASIGLTRVIQPDVTDSVSFTEEFDANIGGKSIYDLVDMKDATSSDLTNAVGDEARSAVFGSMLFNEIGFNTEGKEATISTVIGLTEEVQIILT